MLILALLFGGLEAYLQVQNIDDTKSISAVGIPIFQEDAQLTYSHLPNSSAYNGYSTPPPLIKINSLGLRDD